MELPRQATREPLDLIANIVNLAPPSTAAQVLVPTPIQRLSTELAPAGADAVLTNDDAPYDSESDLSEVAIPVIERPSTAPSNHEPEFAAGGNEDSESSAAGAQGETDDADFDMEDSPAAPAANGERHDRSTSVESPRPAKRKIGIKEDEYILANPELYGLRRSVRPSYFAVLSATLTSRLRVAQRNTGPLYVFIFTLETTAM
jgi:chromodomain-helicase-DNA-binding protein 1